MNEKRHHATGKFLSHHDDERFIESLKRLDGQRCAENVAADMGGIPYRTAAARLRELADEGRLRRERDSYTWVYSIPGYPPHF